MASFESIVNGSSLYLNGMMPSFTSTTVLSVSAGIARDQTDSFDMILGNYLGLQSPIASQNVATSLNFAVNGINGLDTGILVLTRMYYLYVIADPSGFRPTGVIASLSLPSVGPLMPFGYGLQRWIGCWGTDAAALLLAGYYSGKNNEKSFYYDVSRATAVTAGNSATYAIVNLNNFVPFIANLPVSIQTNFTANAAADTLNLQPQSGTGDAVLIIAQVAGATAHLVNINKVVSQLVTTNSGINYKVSAGTVAVNVNGFDLSL